MNPFNLSTSVPALTVFFQGLLSFFSPCVLPLVPLYVGYLAGGMHTVGEDGEIEYPRGKVMLHTLFFVLGVSFAFFALSLGFNALGRFFSGNRAWFARISGLIMIFFGLYQLGVFGRSAAVDRDRRLPLRLDRLAMNPLTALLLGFTFSFAWTPCVGPTLGSVLLMASTAGSSTSGFLLIGVYTLGFVLPFLAVGLFTGSVLQFFKKNQKVVQYTVKIGAVLLIFMGIMTLTGFVNGLTRYLSAPPAPQTPASSSVSQSSANEPAPPQEPSASADSSAETPAPAEEDAEKPAIETYPMPDFELTDLDGNTHRLSDYKGKTVFVNFFATWCQPCRMEMPHMQKLYEEYGENKEDVIFLVLANPSSPEHPNGADSDAETVREFIKNSGYTFPVLLDTTGEVFDDYGIAAFPTTFMFASNNELFGYVKRTLTEDMMRSIIDQTVDAGSKLAA